MDNIHYLSVSYKKNSSLAKLYLFFATTALILFYYAHAEWIGTEKLFYIPCGLALVSSLLIQTKYDIIDGILAILILFSIISDIIFGIIPNDILTSEISRFCLGILCFNKLRFFNLQTVIRLLTYLSTPIIMSYYIFDNPLAYNGIGRYGGFSGDPNYLAISLNLLAAINLLYIKNSTSKYMQAVVILNLLLIIPIFIAGQSRIGSVSYFIILLFATITLYKKSKSAFIILCIICGGAISIFIINNADVLDGFISRFDGSNKVDVGAATSRFDQMEGVIEIFKEYPYFALFGIGIDASALDYSEYRTISHNIVHNTYFNILLHQGIMTLIVFLFLLYKIFLKIKQSNDLIIWGLFIGTVA